MSVSSLFRRKGSLRLVFSLVLVFLLLIIGYRLKTSNRQFRLENEAVFTGERKFSLDNLERLADGKVDDRLEKLLSGIKLSQNQIEILNKSFYSPFLLRESAEDGEFASNQLKKETLASVFAALPNLDADSNRLVEHVAGLDPGLAQTLPTASTVIFSKSSLDSSRVYAEALLWYFCARHLLEKNEGQKAFRVFLGIIDLAAAWENNRVSHPDKFRRLQSCYIREVAAVGLCENAGSFFANREEMLPGLEELAKRSGFFVGIDKILTCDKQIPLEFGRILTKAVADGSAEKKYHARMTTMADVFGKEKLLAKYLDPLYDNLVTAAGRPYPEAQKEFNRWNSRYAELFADLSPDSGTGIFKLLLFPTDFYQQALLSSFAENLPFYVLIDMKARQILEGAQAAIILNVYFKDTATWPDALGKIEEWLQKPLPKDLVREIPLQFEPGTPPRLASVGRDGRTNTHDDLIFVPFGRKVKE